MSFFITLIELTDSSRRELEDVPKVHSMIHKGLDIAEYRAFLHDLYHVVWHFCPVMAAAVARCDRARLRPMSDADHRNNRHFRCSGAASPLRLNADEQAVCGAAFSSTEGLPAARDRVAGRCAPGRDTPDVCRRSYAGAYKYRTTKP